MRKDSSMKDLEKLKELTKALLIEIGEDPSREGLLKTPDRVAKSWKYFSKVYWERKFIHI